MVGARGVFSLYWYSTHSRAERLPRRYCQASAGMPLSVVCSSRAMAPRSRSGLGLLGGPRPAQPRRAGLLLPPERVRLHRLEPEMQFQQFPAPGGPRRKVLMKGQARELPHQVYGVLFAVVRGVQGGVGVGEYVPGGNGYGTLFNIGIAG